MIPMKVISKIRMDFGTQMKFQFKRCSRTGGETTVPKHEVSTEAKRQDVRLAG